MSESPLPHRLAIVIVNYKTAALVEDALASLEDQIDATRDVAVVVDNASGDDSVERLTETVARRRWDSWVRIVPAGRNGGFSAGNNVGIQFVDSEFYLLLNSDTIVRPGAIASLLEATKAHPEAGLIEPRLEWPDGEPQMSAFNWPTPVSELIQMAGTAAVTRVLRRHEVAIPIQDESRAVGWGSFACILVRKTVVDAIGLMDEGYFMYFEDIDFCRRARKAGFPTVYWPHAHVVHLRGKSSPVKTLQAERKRRPAYYYAARARYFAKFYGVAGLWFANACWMLGQGISLVRKVVHGRPPHACEREYADIWMNCFNPRKPFAPAGGK